MHEKIHIILYVLIISRNRNIGFLFLFSAICFFIYFFKTAFKSIIFNKKDLVRFQVCLLSGIFNNSLANFTNGNFFNNWLMVIYSLPIGFIFKLFILKNIIVIQKKNKL